VGEYSKGMARRIGLAQALINDPDLLILDEPTSGLDPIGSKLVKDIIIRLGREHRKTILLSSHLLADVEDVCDRVTILFGGRVRVAGSIDEVLSRKDKLQITCDRLSEDTIRQIESLVDRLEGKPLSVSTPRERLESLFLSIVEEAHAQQAETSGSAPVGEIAGFLGEEETGKAVLESLVKVSAETAAPATPAAPAPSKPIDEDVLGELAQSKPTPPPREAPSPKADTAAPPPPPPPADVDRSLLDELAGDDEKASGRPE
jgi:ABC-2 type transport system ATP-binding protein